MASGGSAFVEETRSNENENEKEPQPASTDSVDLEDTRKSRWERSWPTIACGAGLFSDGYLNNVRGTGLLLIYTCPVF